MLPAQCVTCKPPFPSYPLPGCPLLPPSPHRLTPPQQPMAPHQHHPVHRPPTARARGAHVNTGVRYLMLQRAAGPPTGHTCATQRAGARRARSHKGRHTLRGAPLTPQAWHSPSHATSAHMQHNTRHSSAPVNSPLKIVQIESPTPPARIHTGAAHAPTQVNTCTHTQSRTSRKPTTPAP